jgi:ATP-dependent DNA helicase DinG
LSPLAVLDPAEFFAPDGTLARVHPSYEPRPGQGCMAAAVARTLERGGTLMVEAGTGTGKTLAYLVPAVAAGRRVVVSTGTRNLQDQIHAKDLPFLRERAGIEISACLMKGRENYLCRFRMAQVEREPLLEDSTEAPWISRIAEWSRHTETGDRAEVADLPDRLRMWRDVNARADTCGGTRCPEYDPCWLTRMKRRAAESQIVVVNHHLFFADLALRSAYGAVLPDHDTVIFDEAHQLEEIATLYFGVQVSSAQLEELARDAEKLAARSGGPAQGGGGAGVLRQASREFFAELRQRLRDEVGRARFEPASRGGCDLEAEWAVLSQALDDVARQAAQLPSTDDGAESLPGRAEQLREDFARVLHREEDAFVYGMELRGRGTVLLTASPIDVSDLLRVNLFERLQAAVLTSATMTVEGRFDFFRSRLGLADAETSVVESSFDHGKQAVLYLPRQMPEPRHPQFVERAVGEIVALLETTGGRAFLLFTSYANMQRVHGELERLGRWPLFLQGEGSKVALVERFRTTPRAVLLGTTSFWHGVDVPGEALSLVVIDKLPFDVPSEPLTAARIERIRRAGGNPFEEYQVPLAVLELKQGLGRLLRSRDDRGILAVLDSRLTTRRYGRTFLRSLPPYSIVHEHRACADFFRGRRDFDATPDRE